MLCVCCVGVGANPEVGLWSPVTPADLSGHMRSICESLSLGERSYTTVCQTAAGTACGQRLWGKIRHPTLEKKSFCARKIFNMPHFRQYIKA